APASGSARRRDHPDVDPTAALRRESENALTERNRSGTVGNCTDDDDADAVGSQLPEKQEAFTRADDRRRTGGAERGGDPAQEALIWRDRAERVARPDQLEAHPGIDLPEQCVLMQRC